MAGPLRLASAGALSVFLWCSLFIAEAQTATQPAPTVLARAQAGDPVAQNQLGEMYEHGNGVPRDFAKAARWYRLAAEQGMAPAQLNLGTLYENGQGVAQSYAEAARWY